MVVRQLHVLSDAGDYHPCSLLMCLLDEDIAHNKGIRVVKMADRFVEKNKIVGLNQGTNHSHALLLAK